MKKYICLLRGINISGKNKISMAELKKEFELLNYSNVITYINSGNIIFSSNIDDKVIIVNTIEEMIMNKFQLNIPVFIMTMSELNDLLTHVPKWWGTNNKNVYDNVIFIISPYTCDEICDEIGSPKEEYEKIEKYKNIIFWSYDLANYRKTNWWNKTASVGINTKITIRTANTIRKLLELATK